MAPSTSPPSGNGDIKFKSRAPISDASSRPQNPPRSKIQKTNGAIATDRVLGTSRTTNNLAKITIIVFLIAVADVCYVWHSINASIGGEGDEPHHAGAEAGLHHLHEKKRMKRVNDHVYDRMKRGTDATIGNDAAEEKARSALSNEKMKEQSRPRKIDERIAKILKSANVEVDEETASRLPTWEDVVSQYGEGPIVYGLETCEPYRKSVQPADRMLGPGGIFNTGTNLLFQLMKENCDIREARSSTTHREPKWNGMRWQAPWGKHNPPTTHRLKNVAKMWGEGINHTAFFPVITIKDPYHWMGSQCRHQYETHWEHDVGNCPNLIQKNIVDRDVPVTAMVRYAMGFVHYESLIDFWNKWYEDYEEQTFPLLQTRFEDLLFHGEEVTKIACDCVGGVFTTPEKFTYIEGSAKENGLPIHDGAYGLVKSLVQYGNPANRLNGLTDRDRWYASKSLNAHLMRKFGYSAPPLPT